jgi:hydroxymethylpyrimidine/phosphomethylpyrimidine kinase
MRLSESELIAVPGTRYARVLSVAGSDSGGGAGIQADLKTFAALGCYGMTAITAITAQNTCGVRAVHPVPAQVLSAQLEAVVEDIGVDAVKIGMLPDLDAVQAVAQAIERHQLPAVVLDPVMVSSSGTRLMQPLAIECLVRELFPKAYLITPNLDEAACLLGYAIEGRQDMARAAQALLAMGAQRVLLKGGHLGGHEVVDLLQLPEAEPVYMAAPRIQTANSHGTGCTLSSAVAAHLALGIDVTQAAHAARRFVRDALVAGAPVRCGQGTGPLNHGHAPQAMRLLR